MLVEINLLPQKEPKKIDFIITLSSIVVVMILVVGYYFWQINATKSDVATLDRQIAMTKKIAEKEEQNSHTAESTNSVGRLKEAIDWAHEYPIQTIPVMRELTSLLPERGFIQSFGYTEAGTITLSVQFDSAREAAYFLENLNESKWIEDVSLSSLSAAAPPAETATTAGSTTQTNTTDAPASTTNQTNTTNPNQSTTGQNSTDATVNTGNQPNSTTGTTGNQGNTVNSTPNTNTVNNTSTTATSSTQVKKENTNILPRYTGQFEIKLNKAYVKENIKKSKKDEKGVTGS